jgi:hypothetical protein
MKQEAEPYAFEDMVGSMPPIKIIFKDILRI